GLRICRTRELDAAPDDAAGEAIGRSAGACWRSAREHDVALINVVAQDALGILGRLVQVGELDGGRDAGDRSGGGGGVGGRRSGAVMPRTMRGSSRRFMVSLSAVPR